MITQLSEIEKGIEVPRHRGTSKVQVLLKSMEIGDSFLVTGDNPGSDMSIVRSAAIAVGIKVTQRKLEDGQIRVWRRE